MSTINDKSLGKFIRRVRKMRKLKQIDLARAIGRSNQYVCDLEKGRRGTRLSPEMAVMIADYLQVPLNQLISQHIHLAPITSTDKLNQIYRAVRHKSRAKRIMLALDGLISAIGVLKEEVEAKRVTPRAESTIFKASDILNDLKTALVVA